MTTLNYNLKDCASLSLVRSCLKVAAQLSLFNLPVSYYILPPQIDTNFTNRLSSVAGPDDFFRRLCQTSYCRAILYQAKRLTYDSGKTHPQQPRHQLLLHDCIFVQRLKNRDSVESPRLRLILPLGLTIRPWPLPGGNLLLSTHLHHRRPAMILSISILSSTMIRSSILHLLYHPHLLAPSPS